MVPTAACSVWLPLELGGKYRHHSCTSWPAVAAAAWMKDCAHMNTDVKNGQLLGGTSPSGSLPRLGGRNPVADLSLNSQASAINSADTSKRRRKPAQRLARPPGSPAAESALDGAGCWLERKTGAPKMGFHCTADGAVFTGKTTAKLKKSTCGAEPWTPLKCLCTRSET